MDKPPANTPSPGAASSNRAALAGGSSLIQQILNRRSTKVEPAAIGTVVHNDAASRATTKPTPHPIFCNGISSVHTSPGGQPHHSKHSHSTTSTSAKSSPVATSNQAHRRSSSSIRRHSSSHDVSAIMHANDDTNASRADYHLLRQPKPAADVAKKGKTLRHNRFSHQFTLCCSFNDDRIGTPPPVSVRYNSLATATTTTTTKNGDDGGHIDGLSGANTASASNASQKTVVTVHAMPMATTPDKSSSAFSSNVVVASADDRVTGDVSSSASIQSSPASKRFGDASVRPSTEPNTPARQLQPTTDSPASMRRRPKNFARTTPPVFDELQTPSIAMSACRSRLRVKLLQPEGGAVGGSLDSQFVCSDGASMPQPPKPSSHTHQQHFSSPDIAPMSFDRAAAAAAAADAAASAAGQTSYAGECESTDVSVERKSGVKRPASADSLAKQTLIAAQLFNLIPAERARERNFMAGRLAVNSLFGPTELVKVLPAREVKIYVCTWNMNGQNPPKTMGDFVLPHSIEFVPDLVVVGTQESCSVRSEWEVSLQETLGPSHVLLHSAALGTLHLAVFMRRDLIWFCSVPEDASLSVRPGTAFRTKGAVAISFSLFGTSMLFVTSHLTAHQQKVKERVQDVKRIIHSLDLPRNLNVRSKNKDVTQNFDCVFWCGDLNFRLGEPREKVLEWIECTKFPLPAHLPNGYLHTDQLKSVLSNGAAFKDFQEANITFPPTYKYDPGTQFFDTSSKQRAPAYTDRILFKTKSPPTGVRRGSNLAMLLSGSIGSNNTNTVGGGQHHSVQTLECMAYDSVPSIVTSDHKPVWALFRCSVRPGSDAVPLAAGLFNRDVYLEGMKRRLNSANADSSTVCVIQ